MGVPFSTRNQVSVLRNGDAIFPAMLEAIAGATSSISFVTFVYWDGDIAYRFAEALADRARAGVRVRVLLDAYGARPMPARCCRIMEDAGVELRWFRPLGTWRLWRNDKRTHRKILVIDQMIAFTGGVGIGKQWTGDARSPEEWRETHFELRGPSVSGLVAAFFDNWCEAGDWEAVEPCPESDSEGADAQVQILRSGATVGWTDIATLLRTAIDASADSLFITTPYFAPDPKTEALLADASQRGVSVKLLVPGPHCDQVLPQLAGSPSIERLLMHGVRIWAYERTHIHAKLLIVDQCASLIGSANFNHRSLGKDEECCAVVLDAGLAASLEGDFANDLLHAEEIKLSNWQQRSWYRRAKERLARLILEQL